MKRFTKTVMFAALISVMFGFTGCETKMSKEESVAFEKILNSKNSQKIETEYVIAYANGDDEKLNLINDDILPLSKKELLKKEWDNKKVQSDKLLYDIQMGTIKPSKFEINMMLSQLKQNPDMSRIDYIREVFAPEIQKLAVEEKK